MFADSVAEENSTSENMTENMNNAIGADETTENMTKPSNLQNINYLKFKVQSYY